MVWATNKTVYICSLCNKLNHSDLHLRVMYLALCDPHHIDRFKIAAHPLYGGGAGKGCVRITIRN
jgi:hypothetical protein